ncbi:hypothetical protein GCM10010520_62740 [Rhizobium viscosum]|uniref:Barstar (barnase inhibitor) domain-containing protein n=1 Tax=Rhizobium viscosum TaxID=1673 RepID=A0ABR9J1E0_RHIVS|nr:hypothetical protein [Rhizobium viscosum]MBE1509274.1 hypothetical protein [Rhizobium viscosum]
MGGVNIFCGSFHGEDKSATAFETVLEEAVAHGGNADAKEVLAGILESLERANDHILIWPPEARTLLPSLKTYRDRICVDADERDPRLYCVVDFVKACETADLEVEPVVIVW